MSRLVRAYTKTLRMLDKFIKVVAGHCGGDGPGEGGHCS